MKELFDMDLFSTAILVGILVLLVAIGVSMVIDERRKNK